MFRLCRITCLAFLYVVILSGCSAYDSSMKKGKDALKSGEYEEVVSHFKNALIEEPQDEDDELLLEQSEENYHTELAKKEINSYINVVTPPVDLFVYILNTDNSVEEISNQDLQEQLQELDLIDQEIARSVF